MDLRLLGLAPLLAACASAPVSIQSVAGDLASNDVVFVGEEHDNDCGHAEELQLLQMLYARHPNLVLSMEMFERDVQPMLDDYLSGRLDEETFLESARPWPNYAEHYRPLVEFCRVHHLHVLAANLPRDLARKASKEGAKAVIGEPDAPRESSAPRDAYWERFQAAMSDHAGVDASETMVRFYESQCLKDDTMAESIADLLAAAPAGDRPFVLHVNGDFHSDFGLGTAARLRQRMPDLRIGIVTMESFPNAVRGGDRANWVLRVPEQPEEKTEKPETSEKPAAEPEPSHRIPPPEEGGRPALGFRPSYGDDVVGVSIEELVQGGPAEQAGLLPGDVIVRVGDRAVDSLEDYMSVLSDLKIGDTVKVVVDRGGEEREFDVVVGSRG